MSQFTLDAASRATMANAVRALSVEAVEKAKSGHPGLPMGAADVVTALFAGAIKYDASAPSWPDRDRFVLSAGHGSAMLYSLLHLLGVAGVTLDELKNFRQLGSKTAGHPEYGHTPGVETTTGPLGQGLATAVGMALAERMLAAEFGDEIVDHKTYVFASDGDLMEGVSQEAIAIAGHLKLSKLIVLFDDNGISIDGPLSVSDSVDQIKRFESAGWSATRVDGFDQQAVLTALAAAQKSDRPTLIACKTVIGYGAPTRAGKSKAHGEPLGAEELKGALAAYGWTAAPFEIPAKVAADWRAVGARGAGARAEWEKRFAALPAEIRSEFERRIHGTLPKTLEAVVSEARRKLVAEAPETATRKASEAALKILAPAVPELVTGSADLTGSNNTKVEATPSIAPGRYNGRFVHWGIREHGMAAALNGMALHGGFIPSGATFLVFTDYCRPSIRLAALMGARVIHVMTHDSIGLGEDGPTHQPVEHLASLRCIPNVLTLRPADAVETLECWQMALENAGGPSVMALTRQNLPALRLTDAGRNLSAKGAYEISPAEGEAQVSLFATGSEVSIAVEAQKLLAAKGVSARVVSVPSMERFLAQDEAYRARTIGSAKVKIGVEAAVRMGWDAIIGSDGGFVGMTGFGASGPYKKLYEHFGITPQAIADLAGRMLAR
jgi:transketolase